MPVYSADKENALLALNDNPEKEKAEGGGKSAAWAASRPAARVRGGDGDTVEHEYSDHASGAHSTVTPSAPMVSITEIRF